MAIDHFKLRQLFGEFYKSNNHVEVPSIPLVPKDDPTTLFTGSGMQQLVPYLLGEVHPLGTRLYDFQRCFRSQDIDEIGDNRHILLFEMIGNWSLGDYFKKEQLQWLFRFLVNQLHLDPHKLYVTAFKGEDGLPLDTESIEIWKQEFAKVGITADIGNHIYLYDATKNWWSRAGVPSNMPAGEPGGPDSEIFYEFTQVEHDKKFGDVCHPNCDCGRYLEICNSVFMQYKKNTDGTFSPLPKQNVDFGGGLERFVMAMEDNSDIFETSLFSTIVKEVEKITKLSYADEKNKPAMRIIADHLKASVFLIKDGVLPSNKEQGYVLRRLLRRLTVKLRKLLGKLPSPEEVTAVAEKVLELYDGVYFNPAEDKKLIGPVIADEIKKFNASLEKGLKEIAKIEKIDGKIAFDLYQSYGMPVEISRELFLEKGQEIDLATFLEAFTKHRDLSRSASAGKFKGGLADSSEQTIKYHTATHLLHQALFDVLGKDVRQEGSNITGERLRFDFYHTQKPTDEELKKIAGVVNEKISQALPVEFKLIPKQEAETLGAKSFFREKYPDMVKVYFVGDYSKEFCGGPHVKNTSEIGSFTIMKCEKIGNNLFRIYAK
ncbi:MAG: alanine--tRNA ligase [Candidatus Roizmanbacteria bacterium]|nr:alanine--tRNA ligase [Candidatus Roizmanbacteria bacterium]